jgi:ubiquinone/menaquinone biosynthesis C-methylase UbiE
MTKRDHQHDKMAEIYDAQILPLWSQRFGKMLLRELSLPQKAMVLDVGCTTGYPSLEILRKMDDQGRIIAIDSSPPMLDKARAKAGPLSGKRIFFRSESAMPRLSFADDVYDLVVCNAGLQEFEDPEAAIADFARVCKPGGRVIVTLPLAGTFAEFFDIFREVLVKQDLSDAIDRLDAYLTRFPPLEQAEAWLEDAGLSDVHSQVEQFTLLFKSGREFFLTPVIEYGPLSAWKAVAGKGKQMQDVFWHAKAAIDAYFKGSSFAVSVVAACLRGQKRAGESGRLLLDRDDEELTPTGEQKRVTDQMESVDTRKKEPSMEEIDVDEDVDPVDDEGSFSG